MKVLTLMMAFSVYAQLQHVVRAELVKKHLIELEGGLLVTNVGKKFKDRQSDNSDLIPDIKLHNNEATETDFTPETLSNIFGENVSSNSTDEDSNKTLIQRFLLEEVESMLVAGLHLERKTAGTRISQNAPIYSHRNVRPSTQAASRSTHLPTPDPLRSFLEDPFSKEILTAAHNPTLEVKNEQVMEDVTIHKSDNKLHIKEIGTSVGQVRTSNFNAHAARLSSAEILTSNTTQESETTTQKTVVKPTGNGTKLQSKDKGAHSKASSKAQVENVPLKSKKKTNRKKTEHFPYFTDSYCPSECACYGRVVQCSDKGVDRVPYGIPFNSRYILLMNNRIDRIQLDLLGAYSTVEFLALTNNCLTDGAIEGVFEDIPALKRLYLDSNQLQSVPTDLPASLEELRLDNNRVGRISEAAWSHCPGLLILSMSNNSLGNGSHSLPNAVLSPLCKLQTLNLDNNQLTSVPLGLPLSIIEMYLKGNRIEEFRIGAFNGKSELVVLDLSKNRFTNRGLHKDSLLNATHLESLNLEGNRLKQIPQHLPPSLKTLNLEGNLITAVKKSSVGALTNLEHLGLARNKILRVMVGAFKTLPVLHQLDLGHNALRQVPRQLPKSLHSVALSHNRIQNVPRDAFCWGNANLSQSRLIRVQLQNNVIDLRNIDTQAFRCLRGFQVVHFY